MILEKTIKFKFKGKRDYVHGTDIYNKMLDTMHVFCGQYPKSVEGSFHYLLKNHGIFRIYERDTIKEVDHCAAIFNLLIKEKKYQVILHDIETPITSSYAYDERNVLKNMVLNSKTIVMPFNPSYTYIEQFVAMTKKLHFTIYPEATGKWLFTRLQINEAIDNALYADKILSVKSERNFQYKLTQCLIRLNDQLIGNIFFSLIKKRRINDWDS
jgi:hypothetical protein